MKTYSKLSFVVLYTTIVTNPIRPQTYFTVVRDNIMRPQFWCKRLIVKGIKARSLGLYKNIQPQTTDNVYGEFEVKATRIVLNGNL